MSQRDIEIVQRDWTKVELLGETAASLLYDRLFTLDPGVRALFPPDLGEQKLKLIRMIGGAIHGLSNPGIIMPIVEHLGRKHVRFGVQNKDYATVEGALLWTLRQGLGPAFGAENEAAWTRVFRVLADSMKNPAV